MLLGKKKKKEEITGKKKKKKGSLFQGLLGILEKEIYPLVIFY